MTARRPDRLRATLPLAAALAWACGGTDSPDGPPAYGFACPASLASATVSQRIASLWPKKDTYAVGDTVAIGLCYTDTTQFLGGEELSLRTPGGKAVIASFSGETGADTVAELRQGKFIWIIPAEMARDYGSSDSLSTIGSGEYLRFAHYEGQGRQGDYDTTGVFAIAPRR